MQLLSFFKRNVLMIIIIIVLTLIQAIGVVILPEYISTIIDTGISRYGIENSTPERIRKSEMEKLMLFLNDKKIIDNYELITNQTGEEIYILKEEIHTKELNYQFARAITLLMIMDNDEAVLSIKDKAKTNVTDDIRGMLVNGSIRDTITTFDENQLNMVNNAINSKMEVLTEDILSQISAKYLHKEYETLGIEDIQMKYIMNSAIQMLIISLVIFTTYILGNYLTIIFSAKLTKHMRKRYFEHVLKMNEKDFNEYQISSLVNRNIYDVQIVQRTMPLLIRIAIYIPTIFIGSIIKIKELSSGFENILFFVGLIMIIIGIIVYIFIYRKIKIVQKNIDNINIITRDTQKNIFISQGSGRDKQIKKFQSSNDILYNENSKIMKSKSLALILMRLSVYIASVIIIWNGSKEIGQETLMIGALIATIEYLFQISFSAIDVLRGSLELVVGYNSFKRYKQIFKADEDASKDKLEDIGEIKEIEFEHVYFKYPNTREYVLKDFNLKIKEKDKISIIGKTASGKSTVIKLLLKFYEPESGKILINGIDICKIDTELLRTKIALAEQNSNIISGNIDENIKMGNKSITEADLEKIKEIACIKEFDKVNNKLDYKGKNISGGQKQRISIARELAKNADVLIFDDAFTSLDNNTKEILQGNLKRNYENKIIINIMQENDNYWEYKKVVEL